ncbi:MAG: hypothetical protein ACRDRN_08335 [Sciscionella sp.]
MSQITVAWCSVAVEAAPAPNVALMSPARVRLSAVRQGFEPVLAALRPSAVTVWFATWLARCA